MIEWFNHVVLGQIGKLMQGARDTYAVDPIVFIVIYFVSVPFFYFSIYRMVRALAKRRQQEIMLWSMVFLAATAAPFLYVLFFGRNLPWWVYVVVALLIGQGVYSLIRRLRKKPSSGQASGVTPQGDNAPQNNPNEPGA
jgi:ABC-type Co2+ transport system permease subunit